MYLETVQLMNDDMGKLQASIFDEIKEKYKIDNIEILHLYKQIHITSQLVIPEFKIITICSNSGHRVIKIKRTEI